MTLSRHVSVRDLRKRYGYFAAVDGVSFDIEAGETFALLGPNGAGKSTTIEVLEGYRDRTNGESGNVTVREQLAHFAGFSPNPRDLDEVIAAVGQTCTPTRTGSGWSTTP